MSLIRVILNTGLLTIMCAIASSCRHGYDSEPIVGDDFFLTITLQTTPPGSRTDALHDEAGSEYTALEDGIDGNDLGIFLYVREKKTGAEEKLLIQVINMEPSGPGTVDMSGGDGQYRLIFKIKQAELEEILSDESEEGLSSEIEFRIAVLANCSGTENGIRENILSLEAPTYADFIEKTEEWSYDMKWLYDADGGSQASGLYGNEDHKMGLPMFGVCKATVSRAVLATSSSQQIVNLGALTLLRALAKVRVVDNILHKTGNYPRITGVALRSSRGFARPLPANASSYLNGQQVHSTNPAPNADGSSSFLYTLGTIPDFMNMTPAASRTGDTFIGYIPEQAIYTGTDSKPVFIITIATDWDSDGIEEFKVYEVPMSSYNGKEFSFGENILRNHIYTLSVTGLHQEELNVVAQFTPWDYNRAHIEI